MTAAEQAIALDRFGLGARGGEPLNGDPRGWVGAQLARYQPAPAAIAAQPARRQLAAMLADYREEAGEVRRNRQQMPAAADAPRDNPLRPLRQPLRAAYIDAAAARMASAVTSDTPFPERLVHFWSNHFAISIEKLPVMALAGDYEFTAIRPHVMGRFADLLTAAVLHPAMLIYLDQAQSIGPDSALAQRAARAPRQQQRQRGLNENLGREILELHTLGVRTGYSQTDVTEFARALTGWTVAGLGQGRIDRLTGGGGGDAVFAEGLHQPGARTIMGKRYAESGAAQVRAVLADLARHPATARHIATKLARHFIADQPPAGAVARLEQAFLASDGDLPTVYRALVASPEAWAAPGTKFRSPWDWTVAALRATGTEQWRGRQAAAGLLDQLGQPIWKPGSPAGWGDTAADWAGPGALMTRVEVAQQIAGRVGDRADPRALVGTVLPAASAQTVQSVGRSESPALGLALMLAAPEFLRR